MKRNRLPGGTITSRVVLEGAGWEENKFFCSTFWSRYFSTGNAYFASDRMRDYSNSLERRRGGILRTFVTPSVDLFHCALSVSEEIVIFLFRTDLKNNEIRDLRLNILSSFFAIAILITYMHKLCIT